jgi:RHS repeat-associated protein
MRIFRLLAFALLTFAPMALLAQTLAPAQLATPLGVFPFQTTVRDAYDTIDLSSLGLIVHVPVTNKSAGPAPFQDFLLGQNTLAPGLPGGNGTVLGWMLNNSSWSYSSNLGYNVPASLFADTFTAPIQPSWYATRNSPFPAPVCPSDGVQALIAGGISVSDGTGARHPLPPSFLLDSDGCFYPNNTGITTDGSGLTAILSTTAHVKMVNGGCVTYCDVWEDPQSFFCTADCSYQQEYNFTIYDRSGRKVTSTKTYSHSVTPSVIHANSNTTNIMTDPNGNTFTFSDSSANADPNSGSTANPIPDPFSTTTGSVVIRDPLGPQLTVETSTTQQEYSSPLSYTATSSSPYGKYNISAETLFFSTTFACPGVPDIGANSPVGAQFPSKITFPDGSQMTLSYEQTPGKPSGYTTGRFASITLPTGGQISYAYSGGTNNVNCVDGTTNTLTRTTPDGVWSYVHIPQTGTIAQVVGVQVAGGVLTVYFNYTNGPRFAAGQTVSFTGLGNATFLNGQAVTVSAATYSSNSEYASITAGVSFSNYSGPVESSGFVYSGDPTSSTTVTDPLGNVSVYKFFQTYELQRQVYKGAVAPANLLMTRLTCYNANFANCAAATPGPLIVQKDLYTTMYNSGGGQVSSLSEETYNAYGLMIDSREYDYGATVPPSGSPLVETVTQYGTYSNGACSAIGNYINDRECSVAVKDGSGNIKEQTNYIYDSKGNMLSRSRLVSGTTYVTESFTYDSNGALKTSTDYNGNPTTYTNTSCNNLLPTSVVAGGLTSSMTWDCNGGTKLSTTDPNLQMTSYKYGDSFGHLTEIDYPDQGKATATYNLASIPPNVVYSRLLDSSHSLTTQVNYDGLGRMIETQLASDLEGIVYSDFAYDADGRLYKTWNPTRCHPAQTNCGESTWGVSTTNLDPLDRVTSMVEQDGSTIAYDYSNLPCTTVTDEASKQRKSCVDGLGRMTSVVEDPGSSPHLNYLTSYTYDALDNLLSVIQNGSRQRSFSYDSLSRLTQATNPESGTVNYVYDANGNVLTKTDARNEVITYCYDALNRLTGKRYATASCPLSSPDVSYAYDLTSTGWGEPTPNSMGRLSLEETGTLATGCSTVVFGYDAVGRITKRDASTPANCGSSSYGTLATYDLAGDLVQLNYPSGRVVKMQYDTAMRPTQVRFDSFNGTSVGYNYLSSATYAPTAAPTSLTFGNGVVESESYNDRLQPCNFQAVTGTFTWLNRTNNYYPTPGTNCQPGSGGNNGNVWSVVDNLQANRTQSFGYDNLNRLTSAQTQGTSGPDCWGQNFGYDAWGNLLTASATLSGCPITQLSVGVSTQNRITNSGFSYDPSGDLLTDGHSTYTYDAENRIGTFNGSGTTYSYDAEGQRVEKNVGGTTTEYAYFGGEPIAERSGGVWSDYVFVGSRRLVRENGTNEGSISNGSFEQSMTTWGTWGNATVFTNAANAHSGSNYLQLSATAGGGAGVMNQSVAVQPGDELTFGGWVNLQSGSGGSPGWWLVVYDSTHTAIAYVGTPAPTTSGWTYQSSTYTVPSGAASVALYAQIYQPAASTTIWVDDGFLSTGTTYYHGDHLGSARYTTDTGGNVVWSATYFPFGQEWNPQATSNHYKFTGKERDAESGLDDFGARYYSSQYGRFMTPDWAAKPIDVPYAHFGNPQSLNLYSYVQNNPTTLADADGHVAGADDAVEAGIVLFAIAAVATEAYYQMPPDQRDFGRAIVSATTSVTSEIKGWFQSESNKSDSTAQPPPDRTANDAPRRDANGKLIPDPEAAGAAHTQLGTRSSRSQPGVRYPQAVEYDAKGKPVKRIDFSNHGRPKEHTNPHEHPIDPATGKIGPGQPLTPPSASQEVIPKTKDDLSLKFEE